MPDIKDAKRNWTVVRKEYFCLGMKKDIDDYVARCMEFQRVKVEHMLPMGLLQPLPIP